MSEISNLKKKLKKKNFLCLYNFNKMSGFPALLLEYVGNLNINYVFLEMKIKKKKFKKQVTTFCEGNFKIC